ncbi:MAG: VCBS repeat-containing protein [Hyphomicrobiales bacterium]|nr:VCBS repeat-containing protein [Hyphomicrobiales bacterium]
MALFLALVGALLVGLPTQGTVSGQDQTFGDPHLGPEADQEPTNGVPDAGQTVPRAGDLSRSSVYAGSAFTSPTFTTISDDGAWSWFQDERAVLDDCTLYVGAAADDGVYGRVTVSELDLPSMTSVTHSLEASLLSDDHNAPSLLPLPDGSVLAGITGHNEDQLARSARRDAQGIFWEPAGANEQPQRTSYTNLHPHGGPGGVVNLVRAEGRDPSILSTTDGGRSWTDIGRLFQTDDSQWAYVKYATEGDRLHVLATPAHPNQSPEAQGAYHGYVQDGVVHRSDGSVVGALGSPMVPTDLTPVVVPPDEAKAWLADFHVIGGVPTAALTIHDDDLVAGEVRYAHARWDGSAWVTVDLATAGSALYPGQPAYRGGVTLDPDDSSRLYISSDVHPTTGEPLVSVGDGLVHWEIFEALTSDGGATWNWDPITVDSVVDNLRPIVPATGPTLESLLWFRGSYFTYRSFITEVVGLVEWSGSAAACATAGVGIDAAVVPFAGDFDGDGHDDLFSYGAAHAPDLIGWGLGDGEFRTEHRPVNGTYQALVGDLDGNGVDDVLWYAPGGAKDYIWLFDASGQMTSARLTVNGYYEPLVGDFSGDGVDDVFWYAPGIAKDYLWFFDRAGSVTSARPTVNGDYEAFAGDFDGDGVDDVFWYGPGNARDYLWYFDSFGNPTGTSSRVNGQYRPAVGNLDGNAADDIIWYGPGSGTDYAWYLSTGGATTYAHHVLGGESVVVFDRDGDGVDDALLVTPGPEDEELWAGVTGGILHRVL